MCDSYGQECKDECPFGICENGEGLGCDVFVQKFPMTAVEVVQTWSDEHPVKTRLDDLLEKYPYFKLNPNGYPGVRPFVFGCCSDCEECARAPSSECWHEPVDGGATGKAVE